MNITYRRAEPSDIEKLIEVRLQLIDEDSGLTLEEKEALYASIKEYMDSAMSSDTFFAYLAFDGDTFVGTCSMNLYCVLPGKKLPNGKNAYLQNMHVAPLYRRKGIALKLAGLVMDEAKQRGHTRIVLHATESGKLLFEKCGFTSDIKTLSHMVYFE